MIEFAFKIAYSSLFGISLITYFGAIVLAFLFASFITFKLNQKNRISIETHELIVYFATFITSLYAILQLLLLF